MELQLCSILCRGNTEVISITHLRSTVSSTAVTYKDTLASRHHAAVRAAAAEELALKCSASRHRRLGVHERAFATVVRAKVLAPRLLALKRRRPLIDSDTHARTLVRIKRDAVSNSALCTRVGLDQQQGWLASQRALAADPIRTAAATHCPIGSGLRYLQQRHSHSHTTRYERAYSPAHPRKRARGVHGHVRAHAIAMRAFKQVTAAPAKPLHSTRAGLSRCRCVATATTTTDRHAHVHLLSCSCACV